MKNIALYSYMIVAHIRISLHFCQVLNIQGSDPYIYVCTSPLAFTLAIPVFLSTNDIDVFMLTLVIIPNYLPVDCV
jgi:hypothetical protein